MRRNLTCGMLALALLFALWTGVSNAQQEVDRDLLIKVFTLSHADLRASELAEKQASNAKVKEFAQKMVKGHNLLNEGLSKLAGDQKIAVVAGTEKAAKETYDRLTKLQGAEFDREYLKAIINDHERYIQMFETQISQGKDAGLTNFAKNALPSAREHLKEAQALAAEVK